MASATTLVYRDPRWLAHDPGPGHPESPARLRAICDLLDRVPVDGIEFRAPRLADRSELSPVHDAPYLDRLLSLAGHSVELDPDTATSPGSVTAALAAAGAAVQAVESLWSAAARRAFVLARPPGHHAEAHGAMGFCLVNNVAVAAEAALRAGARRVLIVDWDVHHGNGTQHTFAARNDVMFMSLHQYPFYPGTGAPNETGHGVGAGFTVNCGLPEGQSDADYGAVFHDVILPIAAAYRPDVVLVSAGFDPHAADPLGGMGLTERGFAAMTGALAAFADEHCQGRLALFLEGGYDLGALARSVHASLEVLAGVRRESFPDGVHGSAAAIRDTRAAHARHWPHAIG